MESQKSSSEFATPVQMPTHEEIARQAYELFLARGAQDGNDLNDWLEAERLLSNGNQPVREQGHTYAENMVADSGATIAELTAQLAETPARKTPSSRSQKKVPGPGLQQ